MVFPIKHWKIITPSLTNNFNFSVTSKVFPDDLKVGKIAPVHKSEIKINLTINALLQFCLWSEFWNNCLWTIIWILYDQLLGNQQLGFGSLQSTAVSLSKATSNWLLSIDKGNINSVIFLDIQKVFDTVIHKILYNKLNCYHVSNEELLFFASYLQSQTQCCIVPFLGHYCSLYIWTIFQLMFKMLMLICMLMTQV